MQAYAARAEARAIMERFVRATGLADPDVTSRRYLWTDAFALCNLLELFRQTLNRCYRQLAVALVEEVHNVLARHRDDDCRSGWISGLVEGEGLDHPLAGGLRIGKPLPERLQGARYDERTEWDQDGQYYHYLTKWMHALRQMGVVLNDAKYATWALELARVSHHGFLLRAGSDQPPRLAWKMSIDLSYPLVPFSGHQDPLDGLVTCLELAADGGRLDDVLAELGDMCRGTSWITDDALGIGSLLFDACRLAQISERQVLEHHGESIEALLASALQGLAGFVRSGLVQRAPAERLAFRELGLSIGLHALDGGLARGNLHLRAQRLVEELRAYQPLRETIEACWLDPRNRATPMWRAHEDINSVMLATSLLPNGFLRLWPLGG